MRIIVDEMPKQTRQCPYSKSKYERFCEDKSNMDYEGYICTWQNCDLKCFDTKECPFFKSINN